jgi:HEAT repeat protein
MLGEPDADVRLAVVLAGARAFPIEAPYELARVLKRDPSWEVRFAVAQALGGCRGEAVVRMLERAAAEDRQAEVRLQAKNTLDELAFRTGRTLAQRAR